MRRIGKGFCGTVWASERGPAHKREDGGPDRSLLNDFNMHQKVLRGLQKVPTIEIRVAACYAFIEAQNSEWWSANNEKFPEDSREPCNLIKSQRIPPFSESVRHLLIENYCPENLQSEIIESMPNKDCLIRPYLGRRRIKRSNSQSRFSAFSLRNFPLHLDQLEALGITRSDIEQYAKIMAETLAMMHWIGEIDGNDIEFVLAPPRRDLCSDTYADSIAKNEISEFGLEVESEALGKHDLWVLDFDLCREMKMALTGVEQAAIAFWRNDPYYPRPRRKFESDNVLWTAFREHYLQISSTCIDVGSCGPEEAGNRRALSERFISLVEEEGIRRNKAE